MSVLHGREEDRLQQDELLHDCCLWCGDHAVSGLCDPTDTVTDPADLIHHLDGSLNSC